MINIFDKQDLNGLLSRMDKLTDSTNAQWGKMNVSQMLAHNNVAYEMAYEDKHPKPSFLLKIILKAFVKNAVVGPKPYPKNGKTAPAFIIKGDRDFATEKERLINYLNKTHDLGADYFEQKESHSFGKLTSQEWSTMFTKHLDHHLTQFGV